MIVIDMSGYVVQSLHVGWPGAGTRFSAGTGFRVMKPNTSQPGPALSVVYGVVCLECEYLEYVSLAGVGAVSLVL